MKLTIAWLRKNVFFLTRCLSINYISMLRNFSKEFRQIIKMRFLEIPNKKYFILKVFINLTKIKHNECLNILSLNYNIILSIFNWNFPKISTYNNSIKRFLRIHFWILQLFLLHFWVCFKLFFYSVWESICPCQC